MFPCRLQEAFQAFYTELLSALDGRAALDAMNARHANGEWDLRIDLAEIWFCRLWRRYEQTLCTTEELKAREDRLVEQMVRQSGYDLRYAIHGRSQAKEWLSANETFFDKFRRSFLMIDLFPENEARFPVTYRQCIDAA